MRRCVSTMALRCSSACHVHALTRQRHTLHVVLQVSLKASNPSSHMCSDVWGHTAARLACSEHTGRTSAVRTVTHITHSPSSVGASDYAQ